MVTLLARTLLPNIREGSGTTGSLAVGPVARVQLFGWQEHEQGLVEWRSVIAMLAVDDRGGKGKAQWRRGGGHYHHSGSLSHGFTWLPLVAMVLLVDADTSLW